MSAPRRQHLDRGAAGLGCRDGAERQHRASPTAGRRNRLDRVDAEGEDEIGVAEQRSSTPVTPSTPSISGCGSGNAPRAGGVARSGAGNASANARSHCAASGERHSRPAAERPRGVGERARRSVERLGVGSRASDRGGTTLRAPGRLAARRRRIRDRPGPRGSLIAACAACATQCAAESAATTQCPLPPRIGRRTRGDHDDRRAGRGLRAEEAIASVGSPTTTAPGASPSSPVTTAITHAPVAPGTARNGRSDARAARGPEGSASPRAGPTETRRPGTPQDRRRRRRRRWSASPQRRRPRTRAHAIERVAEVRLGVGVGEPQVALAVRAERGAGQRRHAGLVEQPLARPRPRAGPVPVMLGNT